MGPVSFSPDGSRIAHTKGVWESWTVPVPGGEPTRLLADTEGMSWTIFIPNTPRRRTLWRFGPASSGQ